MAISIKCSCGKTLKADEKYRGKKAKCPACGATVLVEEDEAASKVQSETPKKKPAPPKKQDDDDDDDRRDPEPRKPVKRQEPAKSNMKMYIIGGCSALFLLTCCFTGAGTGLLWWLGVWPFGGAAADLVYVHEDVAGFVSVRTADIWKSDAFKDFLSKMDPQIKQKFDEKMAEIEKKGDMKIEDIERVTLIFPSLDKDKQGDFVAVMKTSKSMDKKKAISDIEREANDKTKEKDGVFVFEKSNKAIYFASDRIVLFADKESALKDILKASKKPAKAAALTRGLHLASSGKHHLVVALNAPKKIIEEGGRGPGAMADKAPTMKEMNGLVVTGIATKDLAIEVVLTFPSKDIAAKAKGEADTLDNEGKEALKKAKGFFAPPQGVIDFVNAMTIEQRDAEVIVKGKISDVASILGLFMGGLGAGAGPIGMAPPPNVGVDDRKDPVVAVRVAAQRTQSSNNLKQIGFAMHNFHDANKALPNHAIRHPKTGQELLSWRVTLLPYLEQDPLYRQIKLDERWDSAHNRQFWNRMPPLYQLPGRNDLDRTYYQVFHGPASAFPKSKRAPGGNPLTGDMRMTTITDGLSNTIFVVESATSVNWMAPDDIPFALGDQGLNNRVGNHWGSNQFIVALGDGSVRSMRRTMSQQNLQGLITRAGAENVNPDE